MDKKILLVGLPSTGKTTFLAAFWNFLKSHGQNRLLTIKSLQDGNESYLNSLLDKWLQYQQAPRTLAGTKDNMGISMLLERTTEGNVSEAFKLMIPDLSGEVFQLHFDTRSWTEEFEALVNGVSGLILFLDPVSDKNVSKLLIDRNEIITGMGGDIPSNSDSISLMEWSNDTVSNQVRLIEELQFLMLEGKFNQKLKVSVIISAWDKIDSTVEKSDINPFEWMNSNIPMLAQFLTANRNTFDFKVFGVSAQGCDYSDDKKLETLYELQPLERVKVASDTGTLSNDISVPVFWAL